MIQMGSYLNILDNSGAKNICCIKVSKGYRRRYAFVGDVITASVKELRNKNRLLSKVKKGEVVKALILHTRVSIQSKQNENIKFFKNNAIILTKQNKLLGTRIFGPIPKKIKYTKFLKIISLSSGILK